MTLCVKAQLDQPGHETSHRKVEGSRALDMVDTDSKGRERGLGTDYLRRYWIASVLSDKVQIIMIS